jgi:hypothetical protein
MIGQRCFYNDQEGTIMWIGYLEGLESERVGIELDTPAPERHSGEYNGKQICTCRTNCGIFVKQSKISFSLEHAINFRYKISDEAVCSNLVGLEKIRQKISALDVKQFACLERFQISRCGEISALTHLTRLRLSDNLIEKFSVVTDIVKQLPLLLDLDLTGNSIHYQQKTDLQVIPCKLTSLVLCRTGAVVLEAVLSEISVFPNLTLLNLEDNGISALPEIDWPDKLTLIDLSKNLLTWLEVSKLPASLVSVNLDSNSLGNEIVNFRGEKLLTLLLHGCDISDWNVVRAISGKFPDLENFRITTNPVYDHPAARQVVIASFPEVRILNGAEIRQKFRVDAEKYVAHRESVQGLVRPELLAALKAKYPREQVTIEERQARRAQGIIVEISGFEKCAQFTTIPSLSVSGFRKLAAKRANWPIELADTEIRWSPKGDESELGCASLLESSDELIGDIFGQSAEISVFFSVKDKK